MKTKTEGLLNPDFLRQYAIVDKEEDFENALQNGSGKISSGGLISVKSSRTKVEKHKKHDSGNSGKKRSKEGRGSKSNKKSKH